MVNLIETTGKDGEKVIYNQEELASEQERQKLAERLGITQEELTDTGKTTGNYKVGKGKPPLETQFKEGKSGNENGRPKGQRNYATIYREAMEKIAKSQNMTPEEMENILVQSGLAKALKGDYAFYRDTLDRLHGKPVQKVENEIEMKKDGAADLAKAMQEGKNAKKNCVE